MSMKLALILLVAMVPAALAETPAPPAQPSSVDQASVDAAMERMRQKETPSLQAEIVLLRKQVQDLTARLAQFEQANRELRNQLTVVRGDNAPLSERVALAIKEHRITPGMTMAQAEQSAGSKGNMTDESQDLQTWEFRVRGEKWEQLANGNPQKTIGYVHTVRAVFEKGKVTSVEKFVDPAAVPPPMRAAPAVGP